MLRLAFFIFIYVCIVEVRARSLSLRTDPALLNLTKAKLAYVDVIRVLSPTGRRLNITAPVLSISVNQPSEPVRPPQLPMERPLYNTLNPLYQNVAALSRPGGVTFLTISMPALSVTTSRLVWSELYTSPSAFRNISKAMAAKGVGSVVPYIHAIPRYPVVVVSEVRQPIPSALHGFASVRWSGGWASVATEYIRTTLQLHSIPAAGNILVWAVDVEAAVVDGEEVKTLCVRSRTSRSAVRGAGVMGESSSRATGGGGRRDTASLSRLRSATESSRRSLRVQQLRTTPAAKPSARSGTAAAAAGWIGATSVVPAPSYDVSVDVDVAVPLSVVDAVRRGSGEGGNESMAVRRSGWGGGLLTLGGSLRQEDGGSEESPTASAAHLVAAIGLCVSYAPATSTVAPLYSATFQPEGPLGAVYVAQLPQPVTTSTPVVAIEVTEGSDVVSWMAVVALALAVCCVVGAALFIFLLWRGVRGGALEEIDAEDDVSVVSGDTNVDTNGSVGGPLSKSRGSGSAGVRSRGGGADGSNTAEGALRMGGRRSWKRGGSGVLGDGSASVGPEDRATDNDGWSDVSDSGCCGAMGWFREISGLPSYHRPRPSGGQKPSERRGGGQGCSTSAAEGTVVVSEGRQRDGASATAASPSRRTGGSGGWRGDGTEALMSAARGGSEASPPPGEASALPHAPYPPLSPGASPRGVVVGSVGAGSPRGGGLDATTGALVVADGGALSASESGVSTMALTQSLSPSQSVIITQRARQVEVAEDVDFVARCVANAVDHRVSGTADGKRSSWRSALKGSSSGVGSFDGESLEQQLQDEVERLADLVLTKDPFGQSCVPLVVGEKRLKKAARLVPAIRELMAARCVAAAAALERAEPTARTKLRSDEALARTALSDVATRLNHAAQIDSAYVTLPAKEMEQREGVEADEDVAWEVLMKAMVDNLLAIAQAQEQRAVVHATERSTLERGEEGERTGIEADEVADRARLAHLSAYRCDAPPSPNTGSAVDVAQGVQRRAAAAVVASEERSRERVGDAERTARRRLFDAFARETGGAVRAEQQRRASVYDAFSRFELDEHSFRSAIMRDYNAALRQLLTAQHVELGEISLSVKSRADANRAKQSVVNQRLARDLDALATSEADRRVGISRAAMQAFGGIAKAAYKSKAAAAAAEGKRRSSSQGRRRSSAAATPPAVTLKQAAEANKEIRMLHPTALTAMYADFAFADMSGNGRLQHAECVKLAGRLGGFTITDDEFAALGGRSGGIPFGALVKALHPTVDPKTIDRGVGKLMQGKPRPSPSVEEFLSTPSREKISHLPVEYFHALEEDFNSRDSNGNGKLTLADLGGGDAELAGLTITADVFQKMNGGAPAPFDAFIRTFLPSVPTPVVQRMVSKWVDPAAFNQVVGALGAAGGRPQEGIPVRVLWTLNWTVGGMYIDPEAVAALMKTNAAGVAQGAPTIIPYSVIVAALWPSAPQLFVYRHCVTDLRSDVKEVIKSYREAIGRRLARQKKAQPALDKASWMTLGGGVLWPPAHKHRAQGIAARLQRADAVSLFDAIAGQQKEISVLDYVTWMFRSIPRDTVASLCHEV